MLVDGGLSGEDDGGWLIVGAFAETDGDAGLGHAAGVVLGAEEVGLEDGADAAVLLVEVLDEGEGAIDVGVGLHVDLDAAADGVGFADEDVDVAAAEVVAEIEAELGEFDGDGGGEVGGGDGVEGGFAELTGGIGLVRGGDVFAEVIEGGEEAFGVELVADAENVFE